MPGAPNELPSPLAGFPNVSVAPVPALLPPKSEVPVFPAVLVLEAPKRPPSGFVVFVVFPPVFPKSPPAAGVLLVAVFDDPKRPPVAPRLVFDADAPKPVPGGLEPNPPVLLALLPPREKPEPALPSVPAVLFAVFVLADPNRKLAGLFWARNPVPADEPAPNML